MARARQDLISASLHKSDVAIVQHANINTDMWDAKSKEFFEAVFTFFEIMLSIWQQVDVCGTFKSERHFNAQVFGQGPCV